MKKVASIVELCCWDSSLTAATCPALGNATLQMAEREREKKKVVLDDCSIAT